MRTKSGRSATDALVHELLAEREIRRQLSNYCRAVDRFDVDLWRSVWHEDCTLDYEAGAINGPADKLANMMTFGHGAWESHSHQMTTSMTEVRGDRAVSETYATAILRGYPDAAGRVIDDHYRGRYLDRWSKRDGRWAIEHRRLPGSVMWRQTACEPRLGRVTRRDHKDPSYALFASLDGDDDGLGAVLAEREIRRQLHTYCRAVDRFDPELWRSVWHHDGTLDYVDSELQGAAADMAELMTLGHHVWASHTHQSTNSIIKICGDRAVSETYGTNILYARPDHSGRMVDSHYRSRYLDRWSSRGGRWAIDHRQAISDFSWTQISAGGVGPRAARGREDPSYAAFATLGQPLHSA